MPIITTTLVSTADGNPVYPDFCIVKEIFCHDPDDKTFVTIGLGGGTEITKAQLVTRALDIHTRYPFENYDHSGDPPNPPVVTNKTTSEVETMVDDWCTERNVS